MSELEVTVQLRRDELEKWLAQNLGLKSIRLKTKAAIKQAVCRILEVQDVKIGPFGGVDVTENAQGAEEERLGNELEITLRGPHDQIRRACSAVQPITR